MHDLVMDHLRTDDPAEPGLTPEQMIGRTFLVKPAEDQSHLRAKIVERVHAHKDGMTDDEDNATAIAKF